MKTLWKKTDRLVTEELSSYLLTWFGVEFLFTWLLQQKCIHHKKGVKWAQYKEGTLGNHAVISLTIRLDN